MIAQCDAQRAHASRGAKRLAGCLIKAACVSDIRVFDLHTEH